MERIYQAIITEHFQLNRQMLFFVGPRQVGKTTLSLSAQHLTKHFFYCDWDNFDDRQMIMTGPQAIAQAYGLDKARATQPIIVFDEIHKYKQWKTFIKGFFDTYHQRCHIIVTGSARLDIFRSGGDSLMGRYFLYHIHPFSVAECLHSQLDDTEFHAPAEIDKEIFANLWQFGGYPEPFLKANKRFIQQWRRLRQRQLFREDIQNLTHLQEIEQLEFLATLLKNQAGQLLTMSSLANKLNVTSPTVKRWLETLQSFYYIFTIKPWSHNITRSLLKEPKLFFWDWADIDDPGAKSENFIAAHLLKAVHLWTDHGLGEYGLYFIRDKDKREIDFVVTKNKKPWFLVEVKHSANRRISKNLYRFQQQTQALHAFQVVITADYEDVDCFQYYQPVIVPAKTLLSQLV